MSPKQSINFSKALDEDVELNGPGESDHASDAKEDDLAKMILNVPEGDSISKDLSNLLDSRSKDESIAAIPSISDFRRASNLASNSSKHDIDDTPVQVIPQAQFVKGRDLRDENSSDPEESSEKRPNQHSNEN